MNRILDLKVKVQRGVFPKDFKHFAGAGLIITDDPYYRGNEEDIVICTKHAGALSWLVYELKAIYTDQLDYSTKHSFYPLIGRVLQKTFINEGEIIDSMLSVIEEIQENWDQ